MNPLRRFVSLSIFYFTVFALTLALTATVLASPRSDAWNLRRSDPQAALTQLQQVVRDDPNDAKAYWFMTLLLKDMNRPVEAIEALQNARRVDPALSFTDNATGVEKIEASLIKAAASSNANAAAPAVPEPQTEGATAGNGSLRGQGWAAYKAGDSERALQLLQQSGQANPRDAKTQWFLAQVLEALGRNAEALVALRTARSLDPSMSFASSPSSVEKKERGLVRKAGGSPAVPNNADVPGNGAVAPATSGNGNGNGAFSREQQQEMLRALETSNVYVEPSMRTIVNPQQIASSLKRSPLQQVEPKVVVIDQLPPGVRSVGSMAEKTHEFLALDGSGFVVVVAGRNVGAYGARLDADELDVIVERAAKTFDSESYAAGITQIVRAADQQAADNLATGGRVLLVTGSLVAGGIFLFRRKRRKRNAQRLATARQATRDLASQLAPELEKLDTDFEYALLGEQDAARKSLLQEQRRVSGEAFSNGMQMVGNAQSSADFERAHTALQSAQALMRRARNVLEGRPENEGVQLPAAFGAANGQDGYRTPLSPNNLDVVEVPPLGANMAGAQGGYALDFFTSQPVPRNEMVPVDIEVNGQRRRVWASRQSAQQAMSGNPQIATLNGGGGPRAWFDVPDYNPWQSFGSQMLQMVALNMLINQMAGQAHTFSHGYGGYDSYGGGWFDSGYSGYDNGYGAGHSRGRDEGIQRDSSYDDRMAAASHSAGEASLDSPFAGGSDWSAAGDTGGGASLDMFGGGSTSGFDRS